MKHTDTVSVLQPLISHKFNPLKRFPERDNPPPAVQNHDGMLMDFKILTSCFVLQTHRVIDNMNASVLVPLRLLVHLLGSLTGPVLGFSWSTSSQWQDSPAG